MNVNVKVNQGETEKSQYSFFFSRYDRHFGMYKHVSTKVRQSIFSSSLHGFLEWHVKTMINGHSILYHNYTAYVTYVTIRRKRKKKCVNVGNNVPSNGHEWLVFTKSQIKHNWWHLWWQVQLRLSKESTTHRLKYFNRIIVIVCYSIVNVLTGLPF